MADGEVIEINDRIIQCFYTPGHTNDSISFLIDAKYLFVGDLFINPDKARYDKKLQKISQEKMLQVEGVEYVFTGHFGLFKDARFFRWRWG